MLSVSSWFYFLINIDQNNGRKSCENRLNAVQVMFILDFCKNTLIWTVFETKIKLSLDHMKKWSIIFLWFELKTVRFLLQMSSLVWLKSEKVVKWKKTWFSFESSHTNSMLVPKGENWEKVHFTKKISPKENNRLPKAIWWPGS